MRIDTVSDDGPRSGVLIEACIASVADARAAVAGGADRLELNRDLERDGLTPAPSLLRAVLDVSDLPVITMVRSHDDGFVYTEAEIQSMLGDAGRLLEAGAAGIAVGPLSPKGAVETAQLGRFVDIARGRDVVFHRAFDRVASMDAALETLIDCGVTRVLTSGQAATAHEGIQALRFLIEQAAGRIEILPGAGVGPGVAREIIEKTGCTQLHGSFRERGRPEAGTDASTVALMRREAAAARSRLDRPGD